MNPEAPPPPTGPPAPSNPHQRPRLRTGTLIALSVLAAGLAGLFIGTQATSSSVRERRETLSDRAESRPEADGQRALSADTRRRPLG